MLASFSALIAVSLSAVPTGSVQGSYLEARTCDVFTGPCFANADTGLTGRHAVMAWKIDKGTFAGADLDGLQVVAVLAAGNTLGLEQHTQAESILVVDEKADAGQREALIALAKKQANGLLDKVVDVRQSPIDLEICPCAGNACGTLKAKDIAIETRCLDADHDRGCGNESRYYEPLTAGVKAIPAMAVEHAFSGEGFGENWSDADRRGAYIGTFEVK